MIPHVPLPRLAEPFAIGQALYNPAQMTQGVVSLLALMGVRIYRDDGSPVDNGVVTGAGDPWLFESEVWALIDMGREDMLAAPDEGPRYRLKDLYDALQGSLPGTSLDAFVGAYTQSYASYPGDLGPSVMLGQPIDSSTPLNRVQVWLLYMDGFVALPPTSTADVRRGAVAAATRPRSGTANAALPQLSQPQDLTVAQWRELIAHFMTIVSAIPFWVSAPFAHEGHGGLGTPVKITAGYRAGRAFVSPSTGLLLLAAGSGPFDGLQVTWSSNDLAKYNAHGTLAPSIPGSGVTDVNGKLQITYTPKREVANGQGAQVTDTAMIKATVSERDLLLRAYKINTQSVTGFLLASTLRGGRRDASGSTVIEWHTPGIKVTITNTYDVTMNASTVGTLVYAHRNGVDTFEGTLTKRSDGTYRGVFTGKTKATAEMEFGAGLAADTCQDTSDGIELLTVVARRADPRIDVGLDVLGSGTFGPDDFILSFYPVDEPTDPSPCQGNIDYLGPGPDGETNYSGSYVSFSDSRITDPTSGGLRIHLPKTGEQLTYEDWRQVKENLPPDTGVDSFWTIVVDRQTGS